jgi:hypothetical protein
LVDWTTIIKCQRLDFSGEISFLTVLGIHESPSPRCQDIWRGLSPWLKTDAFLLCALLYVPGERERELSGICAYEDVGSRFHSYDLMQP